jgi:hypothetical protein
MVSLLYIVSRFRAGFDRGASFPALMALALALAILAPSAAHSQTLGVGRLLSPGDLAKSHEELDSIKKCIDCHDLRGGVNNEKCLDCHKEVKALVSANKGYHSHSSVRDKKCEKCHPDHKGKALYMIVWDGKKRENFDHGPTGYPLKDKHKIAECEKCHAKKTEKGSITYLGLSTDCVSCHKGPHQKTLGEKCADCHLSMNSWKGLDVKFDHEKQAKYPLDGKHQRVTCEKCHQKKTKEEAVFKVHGYESCVTCHKKDDVHKGSLGDKCESCHTADDWKKVRFNHDKAKFALKGKHRDEKCEACHPSAGKGVFKMGKFDACSAAGCHDIEGRGAVHGEQFKDVKCDDCHNENGWKPSLFKHDSPAYKGFKLKGKHAKAECAECHKAASKVAKYKKGVPAVLFRPIDAKRCDNAGCHDIGKRGGEAHGKQFKGRPCDECHNEASWKPSLFKHEDAGYKGYKLEAAHSKVKCEGCHYKDSSRVAVFKPIDTKRCDNANCHDKPERGAVHGTQFAGQDCAQCHKMDGWKPALFTHDAPGYKGYRLDGKHKEVKCEKCHKPDPSRAVLYDGKSIPMALFKPIATDRCDAAQCHADPHKKLFAPKRCDHCHVAADWKNMTAAFDHSLDTKYPLTGKHKTAKCENCHKNKVWKPLSLDCNSCHAKDDKHKGKLGASCGDCHATASWSPKPVAHERTGFPLTETHAQLTCADCHTKGKGDFSGLSPDCQQCHTDPHLNQMGRLCNDCHNMRSWEPTKFRHSMTGFRLEGGHRFVDCARCHAGRIYRVVPSDCVFCHATDFRKPSATSFHAFLNPTMDTNCARCHTQYTWSLPRRR